MSVYDRVVEMSTAGIDVQVMTIIFRSEGIADAEVAEAYAQMLGNVDFTVTTERGLPSFMLL